MNEQIIKTTEIQQLIDLCKRNLDLANAKLGEEYYYASLPLCVIDAVFSVGVTYESTRRVVMRFCDEVNRQKKRDDSSSTLELSITDFIGMYDECPPQMMADNVYQNRQRTSPRNGILKAEAALRVAQTLKNAGAEFKADVFKIDNPAKFEAGFKEIPGQGSGISLRYFYMLSGSDDEIKPDRMIRRFIEAAITREPKIEECLPLLLSTCKMLKTEYSDLTPRSLDYLIWNFQRSQ